MSQDNQRAVAERVGIRWPSMARRTRLLGHLPTRWRLLFELLAQTGLRISELIGLTSQDVMFGDRPRLLVRRQDCRGEIGALKSDQSCRDVPLSPRMAERLWALAADKPGTERVFTSPRGLPLAYGNLRSRVLITGNQGGWPRPARRAGRVEDLGDVPHLPPHLRFVAVRGRARRETSLSLLGHADAGFTLRTYVHLMDEGVGDAAFMDEAVRVGNRWATQDPQTAATETPARIAEIA